MSVSDLPKIELHMHLEGAAPPAFIRGLAAEKRPIFRGFLVKKVPINTKTSGIFSKSMRRRHRC